MMYHSGIYSLNKDVLHLILEFHGKKAYATFGLVNKEFHKLFDDDDDDEAYDETTTTATTMKKKTKKKETFIGFISPQILMEEKRGKEEEEKENLLLFGTSSAMRMLIKYRSMGLLDWAIKQQGQEQQQLQATCITSYGSYLLRMICHDAAQSKDGLFILKYVFDFNYNLLDHEQKKRRSMMRNDRELSVYAAKYGHVSTLKWLHENGFGISFERALYSATSQGHLDAIQFLFLHANYANNALMYSKLCTSAAMSNHLEVLKWLYNNINNHSYLDIDICSDTAFSGHLQVLKWLKSQGCTYDKDNCKQRAMDSDQIMDDKEKAELVQWIELNM